MGNRRQKPDFLPTVRDIRKACEKIQSSWSEKEKNKRIITKQNPFEVPVVTVMGFNLDNDDGVI